VRLPISRSIPGGRRLKPCIPPDTASQGLGARDDGSRQRNTVASSGGQRGMRSWRPSGQGVPESEPEDMGPMSLGGRL
jgi:hypothetical protein